MESTRQGNVTRRNFLARAGWSVAGGWAAINVAKQAMGEACCSGAPCQAALVHGNSRAGNTVQAMKLIEAQIKQGLAKKKTVVIKPNMVVVDKPLSASHADYLEGILDFLKPHFKGDIIIAESPAGGSAAEGFSNYGYDRLKKKYPIKFLDLDEQPSTTRQVVNERWHASPVRISKLLLDPNVYLISAAALKTHDRAVVTLSSKNITVGAALKDAGWHWRGGKKGKSDKPAVHGGPQNQAIHWNLFHLAKELQPDLALIDGFQAMEGNGPVGGTPVDHKVVIASTDFVAADRIGVELMGFDFKKVGYLSFCAQAGLGQGDLSKIEILGQRVADHVKKYRPHDNIEQQYKWM